MGATAQAPSPWPMRHPGENRDRVAILRKLEAMK
jgi:hypothetical protein